MKNSLLTIFLTILVFICCTPDMSAKLPTQETKSEQSQQVSQWAEVGIVKACIFKRGYGFTDCIDVKLYVMQLGKKILYRVFYDGEYYSVSQDDNDMGYNAKARIKNKTYYFDVPTW